MLLKTEKKNGKIIKTYDSGAIIEMFEDGMIEENNLPIIPKEKSIRELLVEILDILKGGN